MDKYADFTDLEQNEKEGEDYAILHREADDKIAIMAPHGGGIEPGTSDIADAIARSEYTFYAFQGIKKTGNKILHLNSNRFDEPVGLNISNNAFIVISIHGSRDKGEMVLIGGKNQELKQKIMHALRRVGFRAVISEVPGLRGIKSENICNRCKSEKGVQLEISRGLREKMFKNIDPLAMGKNTNVFYDFVNAVRKVLLSF